jgi:hypothetical protein
VPLVLAVQLAEVPPSHWQGSHHTTQQVSALYHRISSSHGSVAEDSGLLGCNTVSLSTASKDHSHLDLEDEDTVMPQNVGSCSPNNIICLKTCVFTWSLDRPRKRWVYEKRKDKQKQLRKIQQTSEKC